LSKLFITAIFSIFGYFVILDLEELFTSHPVLRSAWSLNEISKRDRMDLAMEQEFEMTKDPALGIVPRDRLIPAYEYMKSLPVPDGPLADVNWLERGPANVGGRTRAIMVDPNDVTKKTVWSAGVAGGLWKTTDITVSTPDWQPVDDFFANLAISSITYDPSNTNILYFCTGEGYYNIDAVQGFGVWKSTDGGATWSQLSSTTSSTFNYCQKVVVTGSGVVMVATRTGGVQRSTNGGTSWTKVLGSGVSGSSDWAFDIEIAANGDIFASLDGAIHKSTNGGASFGAALTLPISADRIELAVAQSDANYAYALVELSSAVNGILRTTDGGTTWTSRAEPDDADGGISATDFSRGQAWYDLAIAVDPNNRDVIFVGGVDLFKSTNGGASVGTWQQISHWYGGFGFQEVHADQHIIIFEPGSSNVIYFGNDGGIYRTADGTSTIPTISRKEFNYNTTQFYGCAMHPDALSNHFLAGAQDNGSHKFTLEGINSTTEVTGGDGCFAHIDQDEPLYQFTSYVYNNYYRSTDGGVSFTSVGSNNNGRFINPTDYDNANDRLYACYLSGQYRRWTNPQTGATFQNVSVTEFGSGQVSSVTVSPNTANRVFFGIGNGRVVRVDNAHSTITATHINSGSGMPAGYVTCVEVETGNDNHLLVTFSNYGVNSVWETTNGGTSWTSVEGNLPDMPIRWALFNPNNSDQALLATELGVWSTDNLDGGSTVWGASNTGFANVRTDMLQVRSSDKLVIAATHGRGLFSSDVFTSPAALFSANKTIAYLDKSIQFSDASYKATSWYWDFGDGNNSTLQNPTHSYSLSGKFTVTLTINGGIDTEVKSDYIHVLPYGGTPYAPADGGNFETSLNSFAPENVAGTAFVLGNSSVTGKNGTHSGSNVWVTGLTGNYVDNSHSNLYTPVYNFSAAGTYTIRFWSRFNTETNWDGFRVEYSLDKGDNWNILGTTGANWYNYANSSEATSFPLNEPYFTGNNSAWTQYFTDISSLAGNSNVTFRFVFRSDVTVTAPGVAIDDFQIDGPPNDPLPVELVSFTGSFVKDKVILKWQTETEVDNYGFEIERQVGCKQSAVGNPPVGEASWEKIGFVEGNGNSNSPKFYSFTDNLTHTLASTLCYRLKQIDTDGSFAYSDKIEVDITPASFSVEQNYPNPFNPSTTIKYSLPEKSNVVIKIYNSLGELAEVLTDEVQEAGIYTLTWNASRFASGVYFFSVEASGESSGTVQSAVKKMLLLK
jgi:PKD repeat protein